MKNWVALMCLLSGPLVAQDEIYASDFQSLEPYQTQSRAISRDRKSVRHSTYYHDPFVLTWMRRDGRALTVADVALLSNREPVCLPTCAPFVVDGEYTGETFCRETRHQSTERIVSKYSVIFNYDCYSISGHITGQFSPSQSD